MSERKTALEDQVTRLSQAFLDVLWLSDVVPVISAPGSVTGVRVQDITEGDESNVGEFEAELFPEEDGQLTASRPEGSKYGLALIDYEAVHGALYGLAVVIMSDAYIAGRVDQLADMFGTNEPRMVKARDLGTVYDQACSIYGGEDVMTGGKKNFLAVLQQLRGVLRLELANVDNEGNFIVSIKPGKGAVSSE